MESESQSREIISKSAEDDSSRHIFLQSKIVELKKMKEDLNRAKDHVTQSWLDSRPLIDKLEKKQSKLADAKDRVAKANLIVSKLRLQLEIIQTRIRTQKEEEDECRNMINQQNQELHKKHEEMENIKSKIDKRRRVRSTLRQALKIKRQTIQAMELTYKAIRLESEAFHMSEDQALRYIDRFEGANNVMLEMNRDEYEAMKRRAREETLAAERRVSLAADVKVAAEKRRDLAFRRLQTLYPNNVTRQLSDNTKMISRDHGKSEITGNNKQNLGKKHKNKKRIRYSFKIRKPSIHVRIKFLLVRISKCFK